MNTEYLAAKLYGSNPRLPLAGGKAMLKLEPARNIKEWFSRRGEREAVEGVIGAALVVEDPEEALEFDDDGRLRLRVLSPSELRRFAYRLLEYADILDIANVVGVDAAAVAEAYFGERRGRRTGGRGGRRRRGGDEEEVDVEDEETGEGEEPEAVEEEVEIA